MNYYYQSILKAVDYIEKNLTHDIELSKVIECTGFSKYHFMRIFKSILGYSAGDYIRRRKMTEAAIELRKSEMNIIDIAVMFGYNSHEAFTRAFKEVFNTTPHYFRCNDIPYENLAQLVLTENLLKAREQSPLIEPQIIQKDGFILAGLDYRGRNANNEIPKLWNQLDQCIHRIPNRVNQNVCYGLEDYSEGSGAFEFRYLAGIEVISSENIPEDFSIHQIERSRYAVFPIKAIIESIPHSISEIYSTHLPNSGLKIKGNYDFEYYDHEFEANQEDALLYLNIPIE